jgi:exopolysaccharide biosynthesis polyprenyl glycosylphosphotransferase
VTHAADVSTESSAQRAARRPAAFEGPLGGGGGARRPRIPHTPPVVPTPRATKGLWPAVFPATLVLADGLALAAALFLTYWLRFRSGLFESPLGVPPLSTYASTLVVVIPAGIAAIARAGMYRPHRLSSFGRDLTDALRAAFVMALVLVTFAFFVRTESFSRTVLVGYCAFATLFVAVTRRAAFRVHRLLHERGLGLERVALVGGGDVGARVRRRIEEQPGFGMRIAAVIEGADWRALDAADDASTRAGRLSRMRALARGGAVDRVILTDPHLAHEERIDFVEECHRSGVRLDFVPDLFEVMLGRVSVEEIDGIPLVGTKLHPLGRFARIQKRSLDVVVSAAALVVFAPLFALLAFLVKIDSRGPVLYRQRRIGRDGRSFDMLKFRSMPVDAEAGSGPVRTTRSDDRATRVGKWLRRSSLDEIPQLVNVLKGEMSLVGPRPERPEFVTQFETDVPRYLERHGVKSGLTGWAQAHGLRGDTSIEARTRYDIWYVENWSLALDLKILALTAVRFLFHKDAY